MTLPFHADVWQLLKQNISKPQLLGYAIANMVGLAVVLIGVQFHADSRNDNTQEDRFFSDDYIVLSKRVEGIGFTPTAFLPEEISDIESQPWAKKVGRFTASRFAVNGEVTMGGKGLSTYLFFESVPDEFFDLKPRDWYFDPEENFVPVIICKDYLTLYNFGFAIPQGLPQVSEEIVGAIPISLHLTGEGMLTEDFDAAIVGFSSRLNTIAVPQSFMDWANQRYSVAPEAAPSRLIVKVDRMAAAERDLYLESHGIEVGGAEADAGNISRFLGVVSSVVAANGVVISLLAAFILVLSIFLLLQKNRTTLRNLMLLGYHPLHVARYYQLLVATANATVLVIALVATFVARVFWTVPLSEIGLGQASILPTIVTALAYLLAVTALDHCIIRRHMLAIWRNGG